MKTLSARQTVRSLLGAGVRLLEDAGLQTARQDAEWLLAHLLGVERWALHLEPERPVPSEACEQFAEFLARRRQGEPLQHLLGWEEFYGIKLRITPQALIPRPETELLVEWALEILRGFGVSGRAQLVIDLGTGSGAIACALARSFPQVSVVGVDISAGALTVARQNVRALGLDGRVRLVRGDLFGPLGHPRLRRGYPAADLAVANPPYIASGEFGALPLEVRDFEPRQALDGGPDGMALHRRIIAEAGEHLRQRGWLLMEAGERQPEALARMLADARAFEAIEIRKDLQGRDRMIGARRR